MHHQTWNQFIEDLPLILAGPILQRTEPDEVTVWLALKQACHVELEVYETTDGGVTLAACQFVGDRSTVALGKALHVVAVTARSTTGQCLVSDRLYAYDLHFTPLDSNSIPQTLAQALCSRRFPQVEISYFPHQKPTFVLPPQQIQDLRMVQGSCRKPHGQGFDALAILDCLIAETAAYPRQRPQQLFLTGDQIYGDDVADPLLWTASWLGDALLGWEEALPVGKKEPTDITYTPKELPAGQRAEVVTKQAGFTAGLQNKRDRVTSHLLSFGEYCAAYLLVWSPVCWPPTLPLGQEMTRDRQARKRWDQDAQELRQCIHTLWKVRRALANIPVYSIFDDHDVSDDWNLNQAWCLRVLGRPLGRRAVQNALLAYAVFQAWGNTPEQFVAGQSGDKLLAAASAWSASQGKDAAACEAIAQYIGLPRRDPQTGLPVFVPDGSALILERHPESLTWDYTVRSACHEVIVLDTRTWRGYPSDEKAIAPPMLLCPTAFEQQLVRPLQATAQSSLTTFVVAPTNVFGLQVIDWIHHLQLRRKKVFSTDVGDAWNINMPALAKLLTTLFDQRQQVIVLSGDIHYSSVVRLSHQRFASAADSASVLVQLTSSALKNKETLTQILHTRLKDWLLPEKLRRWVGWSSPCNMVELSRRQAQQLHQGRSIGSAPRSPIHKPNKLPATPQLSDSPEWACVLEWVPRQKTQFAAFGIEVPWLLAPSQRTLDARYPWLKPLMFWQQRWFQEGREVVGLNNIALVQVVPPDAQSPAIVVQELFWFSPWSPTQIVSSRYTTALSPNWKQLANLQPRVSLLRGDEKKGKRY